MWDILTDVFKDTLKMLPFLVVAFAFLEWLESKVSEKAEAAIAKAGKTGPLAGALLGLIPQCGFSVIGANFFAKNIITSGTLIAIFISTSDEALLVLLSNSGNPLAVARVFIIIGIKFLIALSAGFIIDILLRKKRQNTAFCLHDEHGVHNEHDGHDEHDHCCHHHSWKDIAVCTLKRTAETWIFIFAASFLLGLAIDGLGEERLYSFMLTDSIFQPFLASLIGLIPNCAPSVILAQMYVEGAISLGSVIAGLATGAGVGLLMLFRVNKNLKQNLKITALLYLCGAFSGIIIQLISALI